MIIHGCGSHLCGGMTFACFIGGLDMDIYYVYYFIKFILFKGIEKFGNK